MTSRLVRSFLVLGIAATLASCGMFGKGPMTSVVVLYNNTGRTILVNDEQVRSYREITIEYPTETSDGVTVFWDGCARNYVGPERRPGEFRDTDWLLRGAYQAQLEPDGRLYIVPPSQDVPVDASKLEQPPGFPLAPRGGCFSAPGA
jgi:hypothetical protein